VRRKFGNWDLPAGLPAEGLRALPTGRQAEGMHGRQGLILTVRP